MNDKPTVCPKCGHIDQNRPRSSSEQTAFINGQRMEIERLKARIAELERKGET